MHQTLKRYLAKQRPARSLAVLQLQLDSFRTYYNQQRPHRALHGRTPLVAYHARLKAGPTLAPPPAHYRVRHDHVDQHGRVTVRYLSRLHHIGLGVANRHRAITLFIANKDIRIVSADGELIRALVLDPARDYQPLGTNNGSCLRAMDLPECRTNDPGDRLAEVGAGRRAAQLPREPGWAGASLCDDRDN